jgi:hypothetical protein
MSLKDNIGIVVGVIVIILSVFFMIDIEKQQVQLLENESHFELLLVLEIVEETDHPVGLDGYTEYHVVARNLNTDEIGHYDFVQGWGSDDVGYVDVNRTYNASVLMRENLKRPRVWMVWNK